MAHIRPHVLMYECLCVLLPKRLNARLNAIVHTFVNVGRQVPFIHPFPTLSVYRDILGRFEHGWALDVSISGGFTFSCVCFLKAADSQTLTYNPYIL